MPKPIFVLGKQRSGTTWLATQLCEHPAIAGVTHEHHGGIHESAYFSHVYGRYGDLKMKPSYIEFVEAMAAGDTLRIIGLEKDALYALWPTTYEGFFRAVMERHALSQGAEYWLDKTPEHTLLVRDLARLYPDAKFIAISRNVHEVIDSALSRYAKEDILRKKMRLALITLNWLRHEQMIKWFSRGSKRIVVLSYAELKRDPEAVFRRLCDFLELEFDPAMLHQAHRPNTTFHSGRERGRLLNPGERQFINRVLILGRLLPLPLFGLFGAMRLPKYQKRVLPRWFFSMYATAQKMGSEIRGD